MKWKSSSLVPWFLILFSLNVLDILVTNPTYEANPLTIYLWGEIGIFLAALFKIGLVVTFGVLCAFTKKVARPAEWAFSSKLLRGILVVLVAFYFFVVTWNTILFVRFPA